MLTLDDKTMVKYICGGNTIKLEGLNTYIEVTFNLEGLKFTESRLPTLNSNSYGRRKAKGAGTMHGMLYITNFYNKIKNVIMPFLQIIMLLKSTA